MIAIRVKDQVITLDDEGLSLNQIRESIEKRFPGLLFKVGLLGADCNSMLEVFEKIESLYYLNEKSL